MAKAFEFIRRSFGLYLKLSAVLIPTFLISASIGLYWLSERVARSTQENMALRIGNSTARIGGALERYSDRAEAELDWSAPHVRDLLQTLLADPAIRCVELWDGDQETLLTTVPEGLGCASQEIDYDLLYEVFSEPISYLKTHYHLGELKEAQRNQREFSIALLVGGLVIALVTNWISFSLIVGKPLTNIVRRFETAKEAAEAANVAKSDFLAKMSHEIRTPMNGIIGMADLLKDTDLSSTQSAYTATIIQSSEALLDIINDILDFSKAEAGKLTLRSEPMSFLAVCRDVVQLLTPMAEKKDLKLKLRARRGLPEVILGDDGRLRQVLINIIGNAVKFTDKGSVTIRIGTISNKELIISVSDTGIGIPKDKIGSIFSAFEQVENSRTRNYEGTGLGLAITAQIIALMGGEITAQSRLNVGTRIRIRLPFHRLETSAQKKNIPDLTPKKSYLPEGLRILGVDDNKTNRLMLERFLKTEPIELTLAQNGKEALEMAQSSDFDVILMDLSMPVMGGIEATTKILEFHEENETCAPPIIALTANAHDSDREICLNAGMRDFLTKPLRKNELISKIDAQLSHEP